MSGIFDEVSGSLGVDSGEDYDDNRDQSGEDDEQDEVEAEEEVMASSANPVITRDEEYQPERMPAGAVRQGRPPSGAMVPMRGQTQFRPRESVVAVFGADGRPMVARTINGNRVEAFRPPTPMEHQLFQTQGRFVKGGLAGVAGETILGLPKTAVYAVAGLAVAGVAYTAWKRGWFTQVDGEDE